MRAAAFVSSTLLACTAATASVADRHNAPIDWSASLHGDPANYTGTCPVTITFTGRLHLHGAGLVWYRFLRSDGATAPMQEITKPADGAIVSTTWRLSGDRDTHRYVGWQQLQVWYEKRDPNASLVSNRAMFEIHCAS